MYLGFLRKKLIDNDRKTHKPDSFWPIEKPVSSLKNLWRLITTKIEKIGQIDKKSIAAA